MNNKLPLHLGDAFMLLALLMIVLGINVKLKYFLNMKTVLGN